jgi:hypothetical protein
LETFFIANGKHFCYKQKQAFGLPTTLSVRSFQTLKNALEATRTLSVPARGFQPLDPDPLLKSGGNIFCFSFACKKVCTTLLDCLFTFTQNIFGDMADGYKHW